MSKDTTVLTSDVYDIASYVDAIKAKYIDIPEDTLTMGIYGYLSEIYSNSIENSIIMSSEYSNEAVPTKAKFGRNVLCHALSYGIKSIQATPAYMNIMLCFPEDILLRNMENNRFVMDREVPIYIGDENNYEYHLDYDVIIHHNLLPNGKYVYTAIYNMNIEDKNEISDINNPYLSSITVINVSGTNLVMVPVIIRQVHLSKDYKTILVDNPLETSTFSFTFTDQLAYFSIIVTEGDTTHYLTPIYDGLTNIENTEFCNYMYLDENTIRIKFNRDSYQPRTNATVLLKTYTTRGSECNFSYTQDKVIKIKSENYNYSSDMWILLRPITDSQDGKDRDTVEQIHQKLPKQMLMRGSVTTITDLNNYFNFLNNENRRLYFLEKVHNQVERLYYSYLLLKVDNNIVPTNTINVEISRDMFSAISATDYSIQPGSMFYYDPDNGECHGVPVATQDQKDAMDYNGFLYMNPFLTLINKNPFFTEYILNILDYSKMLNFVYVNDECEVQFIATSIKMNRFFYTERDTYTLSLTIEQNVNSDFSLINIDVDEQITDCKIHPYIVLYKDNVPYRYIKGNPVLFDQEAYQYVFEFKFKSNDIITKNNEIVIETGLYNCYSDNEMTGYLPSNIQAKIFIMAELDQLITNDETTEIRNIIPGNNNYNLCNVYEIFSGVDVFYDYSDLVTSYVNLKQNEDNSFNYLIRKMPLVRYNYMNTEERISKFINILESNRRYIASSLVLLEDSFGVDFKFFNTYGPSLLYNIDNETLLNKVNLSLTFEVKFVLTSDNTILDDISKDIKDYLEDINELSDLHMPNLITYITNKYRKQLIYFKFIDLNGYGPIKQSIYKEDIDKFVESTTVPEFLNINTFPYSKEPDIKYNIVS